MILISKTAYKVKATLLILISSDYSSSLLLGNGLGKCGNAEERIHVLELFENSS